MLPPGNFCIVPSTFARDEEGEYMLRVYVEKAWGSSSSPSSGPQEERAHSVANRFSGINGDVVVDDAPAAAAAAATSSSSRRKKNKTKLENLYNWASTEEKEDKVFRDILRSYPDQEEEEQQQQRGGKSRKSKKKAKERE